MDYIKGKISELFDNLPEEVRSFIYDPETDAKIKSIGGKYSLPPDKIDLLVDETQYAIIRYKPVENLALNLKSSTGIPDETARLLAEEIKEQIIKTARELAVKKPDEQEAPEEDAELAEDEIDKKFNSLPKDIRDAITSADVDSKITELAKKYRLHIDKAEELSDETGLVMLGLTHPQDYLRNLKRRLELPDDLARDLVADVNEQIFKQIRESLKQIHSITNNEQQITNNGGGTQPTTLNPAPSYRESITEEDTRIMKESGVEFEKPIIDNRQPITEENNIIRRGELIGELENPNSIKGDGEGIRSGFSMLKGTPIASPSEKLGITIKTPATEVAYVPTNNLQPTTDPYREAVN